MSLERTIDPRGQAPTVPGGNSFLVGLVAALTALHAAIILLLPDGHERFLLGDRAHDRTAKMQKLLSADGFEGTLSVLVQQASPGDYVLFAPVYALAGPTGVMVQNTILILIGAVFLYKLAEMFLSARVACVATLAYGLLPATLFHPHVFVSEAICNPLLIAATYFVARYSAGDRPGSRDLVNAAFLTALLCFTRHVYLAVPLFFAAVILLSSRRPLRSGIGAAAVLFALSYTLVAGWSVVSHYGAERYGAGESVGGLGSNLYLRAERMAAIGGFALPDTIEARARAADTDLKTMRPVEFLTMVAEKPVPFARTVISDAINIAGNPGMAMVFGRFFGAFDLQEDSYEDYNKWREVRDKHGLLGVAAELWRTSPLGFIINVAGGVAWLGFVLLAVFGAWTLLWQRYQPAALKLLVIGLPVYLLGLTSVTAGYTRWDHRSPTEFALALLFAIGVSALLDILARGKRS